MFGLLLLVVPVVHGCNLDQAGLSDDDAASPDASVDGFADDTSGSCTDGLKNGAESDVDCGGTCPSKCADGKACGAPLDCGSGVCAAGRCAVPSCTDVVKNGSETDVDCGGSCVTKCADTKACNIGADCQSSACQGNLCVPIACTDGVKNGSETDIDCGGGTCVACIDGKICALARDCGAASFCNASLRCVPKVPAGTTCTLDGQCTSGNCVDGVCCTQTAAACNGCRACNVTGSLGTCTNVPATQDPHAACTANAANCKLGKCAGDGTCNASNSTSCGATTCAIDTRTDHVCVGGVCTSPTTLCGAYLCNGNGCGTTCVSDAGCAAADYCAQSGFCVARKTQGSMCNLATTADCKVLGCRACASGNCVDGFCCDAACGGACNACSVAAGATTDGTCATASGSAGRPSCTPYLCGAAAACPTACTDDSGCVAADYCNAAGACVSRKVQGSTCNLAAAADCKVASCRACVTGNCVDGFCCDSACSGACQACSTAQGATTNGTCASVTAKPGRPSCAPYVCLGTTTGCPAVGSCTSDSNCAAAAYCDNSGNCTPRKAACTSCCDARAGNDCKVADCRVCSGSLCTCHAGGGNCPGGPPGDCP